MQLSEHQRLGDMPSVLRLDDWLGMAPQSNPRVLLLKGTRLHFKVVVAIGVTPLKCLDQATSGVEEEE